jgi:hypothetical protein
MFMQPQQPPAESAPAPDAPQGDAAQTPPPQPTYPTAVPPQGAPWNYMVPYMPYPAYQVVDRVEKDVNQLPLIAMILSIVAVPFLFTAVRTGNVPYFTGLISLAAIILSHFSLAQRPPPQISRGTGMAIAGLVIGYFFLAITLVALILTISA